VWRSPADHCAEPFRQLRSAHKSCLS
jgi:hypothetical protein